MKKIKISAVSYLNTKPFIFGIQNSSLINQIILSLDTPAECARKLVNNEADIGLLPVAVIPDLPVAEIISGFCIGAKGAVGSVLLVSEVPLGLISTVFLDDQSRTSVELVKIIAERHWKIKPEFIQANAGYEEKITGDTAGVIIGDRALKLKRRFKYVYDLALAWYEFTHLPFVFACWVSNKRVPEGFLLPFEDALKTGVSNINTLLDAQPDILSAYPDASNYLHNQIQYHFDNEKKQGLELFLAMQKK